MPAFSTGDGGIAEAKISSTLTKSGMHNSCLVSTQHNVMNSLSTSRLSLPLLSCSPRKQVESSRREAELDGVRVPTTLEEYCQFCKPKTQSQSSYDVEDDLLATDDYYQDSSEDDLESTASEHSEFEEDSGTA